MAFPSDFIWGSATSSYQVEGAVFADGRGATIWDVFSDRPGAVMNGDTGEIACDHYHRYPEDVSIMKYLGLNAYRFSIAWSRILPNGVGAVEPRGLDFYDRLVDSLCENGITPLATLYHWDLPQALQDNGGWAVRSTVDAFATYSDIVSKRLGDRVKFWVTHNEPWCISILSNVLGEHAPGNKGEWKIALQVAHNLSVSHGMAIDVMRENVPDGQLGIVLNLNPVYTVTDSPEDRKAGQLFDGYFNRWFLDPIFKGTYPEDMLEHYGVDAPEILDGDMELASRPIDFLGINYYSRVYLKAGNGDRFGSEGVKTDNEYTQMGWEVYPEGIYDLLVRVNNDYAPKAIYITENGAAYEDVLTPDGQIHDDRRLAYYDAHLRQLDRCIQDGVPLKGYFAWSLLDNFEWAWGYARRFGIVHVDFETGKRTVKDSGEWYKRVIARGGVEEIAEPTSEA